MSGSFLSMAFLLIIYFAKMSPPNFYMFIHLEFQTLNFIFFLQALVLLVAAAHLGQDILIYT